MTRNPDGTYAASHDADAAAVYDAMDAGETYTTGELAEAVDAPRRTVYEYLRELREAGRVAVKHPHDRLALWEVADE